MRTGREHPNAAATGAGGLSPIADCRLRRADRFLRACLGRLLSASQAVCFSINQPQSTVGGCSRVQCALAAGLLWMVGTYGWSGVRFPFAHFYHVERGRPEGPWWADWKLKTGDGLHLRLHLLSSSRSEVNFCDGTSPAGGRPYEMKWVLLHNRGPKPLQTEVIGLIEPETLSRIDGRTE